MNSLFKNFISVVIILLVLGGVFSFLYYPAEKPNEIAITRLISDVNQDKVKKITVSGESLLVLYNDDTETISMKEPGSGLTDLLVNLGVNKDNLGKVEIELN